MARPVTLFTGQWADLKFTEMCLKGREMGFDGLELACWGDHFEVDKAIDDSTYCNAKWNILSEFRLTCFAISSHLVGQAVCDRIDERHKSILPEHIWGDGNPEGVRTRAAKEMIQTARAAKVFGVPTVVGFTGSPIWHLIYSFPPTSQKMIDEGFEEFGRRWKPILDEFSKCGVRFALEVHPTEIAFDTVTAERALKAVDYHPAFGFNFDPSHLAYQGVDYIGFLNTFYDRIFNVHMKDVAFAKAPSKAGVFGGHLNFGDPRRYWDFRSPGRGDVKFEEIIRTLNQIGYKGPLSVEWEDSAMDRGFGAKEACALVKKLDFAPSSVAFDAAFEK
jgi:sugar phosphate isomerase/epimerase